MTLGLGILTSSPTLRVEIKSKILKKQKEKERERRPLTCSTHNEDVYEQWKAVCHEVGEGLRCPEELTEELLSGYQHNATVG